MRQRGRNVGRWQWRVHQAAAILLGLGGATSFAQAPEAAPAGPPGQVPTGTGITIDELFMTSPIINFILLVMSVLALLIFLYLLMTIRTGAFAPARFIDNVTKLVLSRQFKQAQNLCQNNEQFFAASMIQRCVEHHRSDPAVVMEVLSTEGRRRADIIRNRINYLAEIGAIAPMLGLLGTVIGMIKAFFTLDTRTPGTAALLKDSIAEAMGTTMFGLIVALLAGVFYVIVRGRVTAVLADTEQVCHTVADHVIRAGRSRSNSSSSSERESKQETTA